MPDINLRSQLEALLASAAHRMDHFGGAGFGVFFTSQGVYDAIGTVLSGQEAIEKYYRERDLGPGFVGRHSFTNFTLLEATGDRAKGLSLLTAFAGSGPGPHSPIPVLVCDVWDDFVRDRDGRWLIERRVVKAVFGSASGVQDQLSRKTM